MLGRLTWPAPREESGRSRLSKSAVVDRALALTDATGLGALTIRKLAQELSEPGIDAQSPEERTELQRRKQVALAMLPVAVYPQLVECAAPMTACDNPEFHYDFGVSARGLRRPG